MIHNTAIIDSEAKIAENVKIGPYTIIEKNQFEILTLYRLTSLEVL